MRALFNVEKPTSGACVYDELDHAVGSNDIV